MKILTPSRVIAAVSLSFAALSFGVAYAGAGSSGNPPQGPAPGMRPRHGAPGAQQEERRCLLQTAFNDKNPKAVAVQLVRRRARRVHPAQPAG